jgi:hypothetical protein
MAADAGAVQGVAAAVLATLDGALAQAAPGAYLPELVALLGPR